MRVFPSICVFLSLFLSNALAIDGYQFELIVFSHLDKASYQSENWPVIDKIALNLNDSLTRIDPLSPENYQLKKEQLHLSSAPSYRTVLHLAWVESQAELEKPSVIHLYGGQLFDDQGKTIDTVTDESEPYLMTQNWEMNGTVTINLARYFDLNFELLFALPYEQIKAYQKKGDSNPRFSYFLLEQKRRTKSRELNYIDHPLYGILLMITPIKNLS